MMLTHTVLTLAKITWNEMNAEFDFGVELEFYIHVTAELELLII